MSAICGVIALDGRPVDPQTLARMIEAQAFRGPDGQRAWNGPGAGLAHLALHTTVEGRRERQPQVDPETGWVLAADARLDDCHALRQRLGFEPACGAAEPSDAELVLAAYRRWGAGAPRELLGDFAFAVWHPDRRELFLARDAMGVRQLHYCEQGGRLYFATAVAGILAALPQRPPLNRELLEDQVACRYPRWAEETAYAGIYRLPPGHHLTLRDGRIRVERYWTWAEGGLLRNVEEAACVEEFRALFAAAVRDRARGLDPLGISVSGGLDSSSVACELHQDPAFHPRARIYSLQFDRTPRADEREYLQAVAERCPGFPVTRIPGDDFWAFREFGADAGFCLDEPEAEINRSLLAAPLRQLRHDGGRVMLSGHGGDQVLSGNPYHNALLLSDLGLARLPSELPHFVRLCRRPAWYLLGYSYLRPLVPERAAALIRRGPAPLSTGAGARVNPAARRLHNGDTSRTLALLTGGSYQAHLLWMDRLAAYCGVEFRFPFLDRRLVDFQLRLPAELRFQDGWTKYLLRRAMEGVLPEQVRQRKDNAVFGELTDRGCKEVGRARVENLIHDPRAVAMGLLAEENLSALWQRLCATEGHRFQSLRGFLYVETWLRHREDADAESVRPATDRLAPVCSPRGEER